MSHAPRFHRLAVNDLRRETADAVSLTFAIPKELADDYSFAPGQYLTLRTMMDGEEVRRSYSICSGPDDGELRIAVKKIDGRAFASWAADSLKAGDQLDVMTPTGRFGIPHAPDKRVSMSASPQAPASRRSCRSSRVCWRASRTANSFCSTVPARPAACCSARRWKNSRTASCNGFPDLPRHLRRRAGHPDLRGPARCREGEGAVARDGPGRKHRPCLHLRTDRDER